MAIMTRLGELAADWTWSMRRMFEETTRIWALTHWGNFLDDASELIKDSLSGDIALIDGIATADGLESVIWPILIGLPLHLR